MNVKEMIEALRELPQDAEVYHIEAEGGLCNITRVELTVPGNEETREVIGDEFVYIS